MLEARKISAGVALTLLAGCASLPPSSGTVALPHITSFSASPPGVGLPAGWQPWTLSKFKTPTQYQLVSHEGRTVVKASARASASGLLHPLNLDPREFPLLSWRWKVTALIATADNTRREREDSPVRVLVSFDGDTDKLPLGERMFFDNVRLLTGQRMPYATLVYIWENRAPRETVIPNAHTSRIRMIVAESGRDKVGAWHEVTRNVHDDFRRAFGEEPGTIIAVGIMTDTDNTGGNVDAYYGDMQFRRAAPRSFIYVSD
ncbi:MAG: DUF3047 domain-containing protein [Betaproteobacteria bacterium]|nr:DUF3047 domain-containing protein [Betaproteobacteria bacterium]